MKKIARSRWAATALVLSLLGTAVPAAVWAAPPPPGGPAPRTVSVGGDAEVATKPDRARLRLGVTQVNAELRTAESEVNRIVRAYVTEAKKLGIKDEHLSTTGISIQPEYVWDEKTRANSLVGYRVSRDIELQIYALDQLGAYVLAATKAGINQVQPPQLESTKAAELQNQALVKAAQNARAKARLLADTLNVKLGAVRTLSESVQGMPMPMPKVMAMRAEAAADGNAEMGIEAGEIRYRAAVSAEFDLEP